MTGQGPTAADGADLRRQAEEHLRVREERDTAQLSEPDLHKLLHELQVHTLELELQDEQLRATRTEAETSLARYTELFDFAPIGYVTLSSSETICELNHAAARLLGRSRSRLVGLSFGALLQVDEHRALRALIGEALGTEAQQTRELTFEKEGSSALRLRLTASPLSTGERMILLALEDVTEMREAERSKDEFLAVLSHELRNPLTPLRNSLYILLQTAPADEPARRALAIIERQLSHLTRLVDDLLDVTRITRGKIRLHRTRVELGELARRALDDHHLSFESSGLRLEGRFEPGVYWVDGDPDRLAQVVTNLLNNAEKFTPRGGAVTVTLAREERRVRLSVRDSGVGVSLEALQRMFRPFAQAPQTIDRTRGGLGLGLAMVKGFVELHGGTVQLASEGQGRGAEVTVYLPLLPAPSPAVVETVAQPPGRVRRVLVIDDNRDTADSLQDALGLRGHTVEAAYDGPAGLERARTFHPEVVFCDIGLPGMDGYGVARAFRSDPALRDTRLVALTGYGMPDDLDRALAAGFDKHLTKPPSLDALERLLAGPPAARPAAAVAAEPPDAP
jgi:PAS domain S-box-containing protein